MNSFPTKNESLTDSQETPEKREMSTEFQEFANKLPLFPTPEEKVGFGLQFMRGSLSQEGTPRFREFWEARKLVLPIFKENLNSAIRSRLWNEYVELTVEARRLKEILEEQSVFAMEQIELAVGSLEQEMGNLQSLVEQAGNIEFPETAKALRENVMFYCDTQKELNLLNGMASRLNALRKEVVKTDMRVRFKTKLFKRLSQLGDQIFPRRKEHIEKVSTEFEKDIERFIARHFQGDQIVGAPYFALREEIKTLQGMAKVFTLSSGVFNRTRVRLSECWDFVKKFERDHKKEQMAKRQVSNEKRDAVLARIQELGGKSAEMQLTDLDREIDQIIYEMKQMDLDRYDWKELRIELDKLRHPHVAAQEERVRAIQAAEQEKLRQKREKLAEWKKKVDELLQNPAATDLENFEKKIEELRLEVEALEAPKMEQQEIQRLQRRLKDVLLEKREHSLLSEGDRETLATFRLVLQQKKERRQEIKIQLEEYRKALGSSGLDFEKGMMYQELLEQERERLEKANQGIEEIQQKIEQFEG